MVTWFLLLLGIWGVSFWIGRRQALLWRSQGQDKLTSLPHAYGVALLIRATWAFLAVPLTLWLTGGGRYVSSAQGIACALCAAFGTGTVSFYRMRVTYKARLFVERQIKTLLFLCAAFGVALAFGIILSLIFEAVRFFKIVPLVDFLLGLQWDPQVSPEGVCLYFGAVPLVTGTLLIMVIAVFVAGPCGLFSAIYLSEYAPKRLRQGIKPILEMLAGIPTVVYGFFAATLVAPWLSRFGSVLGIHVAMESALAAGLVMGIMILPFVLSLCDDILRAVPKSLREGALALGSTSSEMMRQVILPAAFPGLVASFLLAISRAIGETMLVVMAAGMTAHLTANPLHAVTTVTVQIVALLTGDQEPGSPKTLAAFALGLLLFMVTLGLNIIALRIVRRYRHQAVS